jgi:hypothetical protein
MVDAIGSEGLYTLDQPLIIENDFVSARRPPDWLLRRRAHRPDHARAGMSRKRDRAHTNSASHALHQHCSTSDLTSHVDGTVSGDAGYSEASAFFRRHVLGKRRDMIERHNSKLCGCSERPIRLSAVTPNSSSYPFRRCAITDQIDHTGAVAVRNDTRIRHAQPE